MIEFFQSQIDYIYFFYGLSFIFLGIVCFLMKKQFKTGPTWALLGIFGILHGLNEWAELTNIIFYNIGSWFAILQFLLLTSSFIFLFEFARNNYNSNNKIKIGGWIYILISIINLSALYFFGINGLNLFVRYTIGVSGALGVGVVFWRYDILSKKKFGSFCFGAIAFWMYAISMMVNSYGSIFGISIVDQNIFFQTFGLPIQLVRGILVSIIVICVWLNYQTLIYNELSSKQTVKKDRTNYYLFVSLLFIFVFGWLFTNALGVLARKEVHVNSHKLSVVLAESVEKILGSGQELAQVMAGAPDIINLLQNESPENVIAVNRVLDRYQKTSGIEVTYVMNKDGVTIATSNRNNQDSFLGKNYSFRSYFSDAIKGKPSTLFAIGVTSNRAGYYTSNPVFNEHNEIVGVVVVKSSLSLIENNLKEYGVMFLVSPEGIVFLSGDPKYTLKSIYPISLEEKRFILKTKLYGKSDYESLLQTKPNDGDVITLNNEKLLVDIFNVNSTGWNIYIMYSTSLIAYYRLFGIVLSIIFYFLIISFFIIAQYIKRDSTLTYFASVLSSTNEAILGIDLTDKIISWNNGAEIMYGYSKKDILGKNISAVIPLDAYNKNKIAINNTVVGKSVDHFETIHKKKDGELINVLITLSTIKDDVGTVIGVSIVTRDITSKKKAEENLKKQMVELEKFKLAADASSDAIVITDKDGHIMYVNASAQKMSGFGSQEIGNNYIGNLWGGHMEKAFYQKMWNTIKYEKKPFVGELKNRRKTGEEYVVMARFYPLLDKRGEVIFFVGVETDMTKLKEMDRLKSEFVSIASHQLRTPLTGIKWFSELLLNGKAGALSEEQKDFVKQIFDSNDRMIKLVDDLLDVSHIDESGKFKIILVSGDFSKIIKEVVDQQKIQAKIKNIKIALSAECLKKMILKVDEQKIEQAMQNILSNAIKYSPNGSTISVNCKKNDGQYVCSFKDKGIGIPQYQQHRMFEKFFRADNVITVGSGTGLGLYIARHIVEGHGGKMWFESKENKGTTVYISLPIK
ncbi:MAG: Sensor protein [uncultured bacterium]|nr:MAG: Sensor protein [uncultured bacterium]